MKFALATVGSRGDVEPYAAVGRELQRRGHEVRMAVPPNYLGLVESAGLAGVAHGQDQALRNANMIRKYGETPNPIVMALEIINDINLLWPALGAGLKSMADGADLLLADLSEQGLAANVAEYYDIPLAALQFYPMAPPGTGWDVTKDAEDAQRRALGLPEETGPSARPLLAIQAYDEFFFPGLAAEWAKSDLRPPFVGALTLELQMDADDEVLSWIASGSPPIYFGFGSTRVAFPADAIEMISSACTELGERALICSGTSGFSDLANSDHIKVVSAVNHSTVFPACRAVVHHGGPGTTFAGIRAGVPTLALCISVDQPMWAAAVNQLGVGLGRRFSDTTQESLVSDLRSILTADCVARVGEVAAQMTTPVESASAAADLLEEAVRLGCVG